MQLFEYIKKELQLNSHDHGLNHAFMSSDFILWEIMIFNVILTVLVNLHLLTINVYNDYYQSVLVFPICLLFFIIIKTVLL